MQSIPKKVQIDYLLKWELVYLAKGSLLIGRSKQIPRWCLFSHLISISLFGERVQGWGYRGEGWARAILLYNTNSIQGSAA